MNLFNKASFFGKGTDAVVLTLLALGTAAAPDSTVTTITHGQPPYDTEVKNAEIVDVESNDRVVKLQNARSNTSSCPTAATFTIDGKEVSVHELVPGTKLTQTITTTTTPATSIRSERSRARCGV